MTSRAQRELRKNPLKYTPKKVKSPIKEGMKSSPGGPQTPGEKAKKKKEDGQ